MESMKRFASAISTDPDWRQALSSAAAEARAGLEGAVCDVAAVFVSALYAGPPPEALAAELIDLMGVKTLIGCDSSGVIGNSEESELAPALSLLAMSLPGVKVSPFSVTPAQLAGFEHGSSLVETLDLYPTDRPKFLTLADPLSCDIERLLEVFNEGYPGCPVVGGLASGTVLGRPNWLVLGCEAAGSGAVGLALTGDVELDITVAQGCRPVGPVAIVTKAEGQILYELAGKPALEVLKSLLEALSPRDRLLARQSLSVGLAMHEYHDGFKGGDFLVRNLMGFDPVNGALMVGASLKLGQTLQFQLRDAETSAGELKTLLGKRRNGSAEQGALLVSCCGRGRGLYGTPHHDSRLIQSLRGPMPMAGFFANGELGPVGGRNFIHGFTSSLAIIR